ncbi:extracellular solute-binding protein [Cohnella silvisoli]|uniref:Extracellular solute-binding protein n=1 Tax=Cohnella silvisoli TaxID=2873699 RepID=A0ABV1KRK2_9BACL|nr:extracellular solute-binding protein [Cohnella silvisoli]MCD9021670.1 extracellular solute-binding protein [Cohnella silvisoli]
MKKNSGFKKTFVLLIGIMLIFAAACSKNGNVAEQESKAGSASPSPSGSASATEEEKPLDITWLRISWNPVSPDSQVEKLLSKHTNVNVKFEFAPHGEYPDKLNVRLATGDLPELFLLRPDSLVTYLDSMVGAINNGLFKDLTPIVEAPDFSDKYPNLAKIPKSLWDMAKYNGKIYSVPANMSPEVCCGFWMRGDLLEKNNIPLPTNTDELKAALIKLSDAPKRYGTSLDQYLTSEHLAPAFTNIDGWAVDKDGNWLQAEYSPGYRDYLKYMNELYEAKAIDPEFMLGKLNFFEQFTNGKSASTFFQWFTFIPSETPDPVFKFNAEAGEGAKAVLLNPIKGPKGHGMMTSRYDESLAINAKVSDGDTARILHMIDWIISEEARGIVKYGENGEYRNKSDNTQTKEQEELAKKHQMDLLSSDSPYFEDDKTRYETIKQTKKVTPEGDAMVNSFLEAAKKVIAEDRNGQLNPMFTYASYSTTYMQRFGEMTTDLKDNMIKVILGKSSLEDWDKYVASVVNSELYQKMLGELKAAYLANQ